MQELQSVQQDQVPRPRPLPAYRLFGRRGVGRHREPQELPFGSPPEPEGYPRIQETNDGCQNRIRGKSVAPVDSKNSPAQAEHHRAVGMGENLFDVIEPQCLKPVGQAVFEQKTLLRLLRSP